MRARRATTRLNVMTAAWSRSTRFAPRGSRPSRTSNSRSKARRKPAPSIWSKILAANKELFAGDIWLICDGPVHQTRRQLLTFGARGITTVDITLYGPRRELHSGHYGNWAPNPAMMLAQLLASMKDESGHVLVDHFYDGIEPLSDTEKRRSPMRRIRTRT